MKISIYTVPDCQFSRKEKEYLKSKNLQFEDKNLEANKDFLTEMLAVSDNFAGTPVTKIEKDDGQSVILKGFTQSEFDQALGFVPTPSDAKTETAGQVQAEVAPSASTPVASPQDVITPPTTSVSTTPPDEVTKMQTDLETPNISATVEPPTQSPNLSQPPPPSQSQPHPVDVTPPPPQPPATNPMSDEKLSSLLENLQLKGNDQSPSSNPQEAPPQAPPKLPSIPDPKFG